MCPLYGAIIIILYGFFIEQLTFTVTSVSRIFTVVFFFCRNFLYSSIRPINCFGSLDRAMRRRETKRLQPYQYLWIIAIEVLFSPSSMFEDCSKRPVSGHPIFGTFLRPCMITSAWRMLSFFWNFWCIVSRIRISRFFIKLHELKRFPFSSIARN